jgi:NAD-dependent DNA ligase
MEPLKIMRVGILLDWIVKNYHAAQVWPGNVLYPRLLAAMKDGHIDHEEELELLEVLAQIAGGPPSGAGPSVSGAIPYDDPPPPVVFEEHCFVLTGQFVYGTRKKVAATIEELGGLVANAVSGSVNI